jgi:hypothetical protein
MRDVFDGIKRKRLILGALRSKASKDA